MNYKFTNQVLLALRTNNPNLAKHTYEMAELLPETQTAVRLKMQSDIIVDGSLYGDNNQFIQICFNKGIPSVLKTVSPKEYSGMKTLEDANVQHPHIISWTLPPKDASSKPNKCFVVMPLMPVTMENLYGIPRDMAEKLFIQIGSALTYLHTKQFVHMDVKPSNICIDSYGNFILIDLGSCCGIGYDSASTAGYYPTDWEPNPARPETDWWMLSVTVFDKLNDVGKGVTIDERDHKSCAQLLDWFSAHHPSLFTLVCDKTKVGK
jgi:serine/threonine protein kinase